MNQSIYSPSEHDIQTAIMNWLTAKGWFVWRNNSGLIKQHHSYYLKNGTKSEYDSMMRLGRAGMPDVLAIKNGILACIEVKKPGNKPTAIQIATLKELEEHGAWILVAYSVDDVERKFSVV